MNTRYFPVTTRSFSQLISADSQEIDAFSVVTDTFPLIKTESPAFSKSPQTSLHRQCWEMDSYSPVFFLEDWVGGSRGFGEPVAIRQAVPKGCSAIRVFSSNVKRCFFALSFSSKLHPSPSASKPLPFNHAALSLSLALSQIECS